MFTPPDNPLSSVNGCFGGSLPGPFLSSPPSSDCSSPATDLFVSPMIDSTCIIISWRSLLTEISPPCEFCHTPSFSIPEHGINLTCPMSWHQADREQAF